MKLCMIIYGVVTERNGTQFINAAYGRLIDQLAPHFEGISVLLSTVSDADQTFYIDRQSIYTYSIQAKNVRIIGVAGAGPKEHPVLKSIAWLRRVIPYFDNIRNADFVYITMPGLSGFLASLLSRLLKRPYCLYFGSDWQEVAPFMANWHGVAGGIYGVYLQLSYRAEKSAVCHSQFTLVHGLKLREKFKGLGSPIVETIPMVSIQAQHFSKRTDTCQREILTCLYVGAIIPRKNIHTLIEAFRLLLERGYPVRLILVGAGEYDYVHKLKDVVRNLNVEQQVDFVGQVSDVDRLIDYYRQGDLFVLSSSGEGFPRVIYEAMSQGLPVIANEIETIKAMLRDREQALLVHVMSPSTLADAIEEVVNNGELRRTLIQNGYRFAMDKIGREETTAGLILRLLHTYAPPNYVGQSSSE